jgi:hypothetical protein
MIIENESKELVSKKKKKIIYYCGLSHQKKSDFVVYFNCPIQTASAAEFFAANN